MGISLYTAGATLSDLKLGFGEETDPESEPPDETSLELEAIKLVLAEIKAMIEALEDRIEALENN